ncbi:MAG TPA: hypothetical protein VFY66_10025 [Anaerolineales bacterium]|nr:hypothetical protein [Anaerolineales bacterium]
MKRSVFSLLMLFLIVACAPSQPVTEQPTSAASPALNIASTPTDDPALLPTLIPNSNGNGELTRNDEQGAVVFEVTPLNLGAPADTLEFDVAMNTHSVDLAMDLAELSTLSTDTGVTVQASKWDAVPGGHHVEGTLIFPSVQDGMSILGGASKLRLTIVDVDVPSRVFEWELR